MSVDTVKSRIKNVTKYATFGLVTLIPLALPLAISARAFGKLIITLLILIKALHDLDFVTNHDFPNAVIVVPGAW